MRIEKIHLVGVGVFKDTEIEFSKDHNIHIFTGENGSGKTTLLHALTGGFRTLFREESKIVKSWHNIENSYISIKTNKEIIFIANEKNKLHGNFQDEIGVIPIPIMHMEQGNKVFLKQTSVYSKVKNKNNSEASEYIKKIFNYKIDNLFSFIALSYSGNRSFRAYNLSDGITEIKNSPFENILDFDKSISSDLIIQWIANNFSKKALALADEEIEEAEIYNQAIQRIEDIISEITNLKIKFKLKRKPILNLLLLIDETEYDFDVLPDGLKSMIAWIADLLMRMDRIPWVDNRDIFDREFILFLDEIDIHLHPSWQRKILIVVQKLFKNAQIFISTHSPFVVGSIEGAKVYILDKNGNVKIEDSKAGYRYSFVTDKIFGINDEFDIETEKELDQFAKLRDEIYQTEEFENFKEKEEFLNLVNKLTSKSTSLSNLIGREIRQLEKVTGFQIV